MIPAAADQVSATTAVRFATHAQMYQLVSAQAAAIHEQFVAMLSSTAGSYATAEAANAAATWLGGGLPPGVVANLAATLAAIPGATIIVVPPNPNQ